MAVPTDFIAIPSSPQAWRKGAAVVFAGSEYTANAVTGADGGYSLMTRGQPGAYPAEYRITVTKRGGGSVSANPADPAAMAKAMEDAQKAGPPKNEIPEKYATADQSGLTFTVKADGPNTFDINIQE